MVFKKEDLPEEFQHCPGCRHFMGPMVKKKHGDLVKTKPKCRQTMFNPITIQEARDIDEIYGYTAICIRNRFRKDLLYENRKKRALELRQLANKVQKGKSGTIIAKGILGDIIVRRLREEAQKLEDSLKKKKDQKFLTWEEAVAVVLDCHLVKNYTVNYVDERTEEVYRVEHPNPCQKICFICTEVFPPAFSPSNPLFQKTVLAVLERHQARRVLREIDRGRLKIV